MPTLLKLLLWCTAWLSSFRWDDRGSDTAERVIWFAFATGIALGVGFIFGPKILDAANSVQFK